MSARHCPTRPASTRGLRALSVLLAASLALLAVGVTRAAATCPGNLGPAHAPTSQFVDHGNGTVTHSTTGLMWKKCYEGLSGASCSSGTVAQMDWAGALQTAVGSSFAGYSDWRVPNKKEIESIIEFTCHTPASNEAVFPNTPGSVFQTWTSSTDEWAPHAWVVYFTYGAMGAVAKSTSTNLVRLVRGGAGYDALILPQTLHISFAPSTLAVGATGGVAAYSDVPNSGNPLLFSTLTPAKCSVTASTGLVTAIAAGMCTIAVNQAGNSAYAAAPQVSVSLLVGYNCNLDIDGDGVVNVGTDGLMLARHLLGMTPPTLYGGISPPPNAALVTSRMSDLDFSNALDLDGNGFAVVNPDAILLTRLLLGLRGPALLAGLNLSGALRSDSTTLVNYLNSNCGAGLAP